MVIFHKIIDLQAFAIKKGATWRQSGFVPTMGALHNGHISLIEESKRKSSITIASIFVNPTQFNNPKDFEKYPVTLSEDIQLLAKAGCDVLFLPTVSEVYPDGLHSSYHYPLGTLETLLEGHYRPGHFQGVCRVVHQLLAIVKPAALFMGQKDFQQCLVVRKLIEIQNLTVHFHTLPTLREPDGLAMSSRNLRLKPGERHTAVEIFRGMTWIQQNLGKLSIPELEESARQSLIEKGYQSVDYVSIAHRSSLLPIDHWHTGMNGVILVAAYLGDVRLIDNLLI